MEEENENNYPHYECETCEDTGFVGDDLCPDCSEINEPDDFSGATPGER